METQAAEASIGANDPAVDHLSTPFSSLITLGSVEDSDFNVNKKQINVISVLAQHFHISRYEKSLG